MRRICDRIRERTIDLLLWRKYFPRLKFKKYQTSVIKLNFLILGYPTTMSLTSVSLGESTPPIAVTLQSPMANLMSITETLPPGSPRNGPSPPGPPGAQRTGSRNSQHSPNSSGGS